MAQENLLFSKDHEWLRVEGDTAVVGVTDYAQHELGDVVYVDLPAVGKELKKGDPAANIESVKAVSDVYSPVSGEVLEVNEALNASPEILNQDPHEKGWIIRLKAANRSEAEKLMTAADYEKFLQGLES